MTSMIFVTTGIVISYLVRLTLVGLLVAVGVWVYKRIPLRSLPWLGAYVLLGIPLTLLTPWILGQILERPGTVFGLSPDAFQAQSYAWSSLISLLLHGIIAVLVLSDLLFLLARAGVEIDRRPLQQLLRARDHSTTLGIVLIGLALLYPVAAFVLWIAAAAP